jgi:RNA polymerase sigma-70 factor, ECF subfamily
MNLLHLLERCEAGEAGAIEEFVNNYLPTAYRLALSILDDPGEADEAAQDAMITALDKLTSFRGEAAFTTWLYTVTLNICRGRLRKRRSTERVVLLLQKVFPHQSNHHNLESTFEKVESNGTIWQAIQQLKERQREVIILRFYHNLPIADISQVTGVSQRTVHNRMRTALGCLRDRLKEKEVRL